MPRFTVRRTRWFRCSEEIEVEADDTDDACAKVREMDETPPADQLELDDYTDGAELIAEFGLSFATYKNGHCRGVLETDHSFTTASEAGEHAQLFFAAGLSALNGRKWWRVTDNPKIKIADVVMATITTPDGGCLATYYRPGFLATKEGVTL